MDQTTALIGGAVTLTTAIFWGAFGLGRIWAQIADHDLRLRRLEGRK
jgi:hypothetical protein